MTDTTKREENVRRGERWRARNCRLDDNRFKPSRAAAVAALLLGACASRLLADPRDPQERFVDAGRVVPGLAVDMRYHGDDNFLGRRAAGYDAPICLLTKEAASALAAVQRDLEPFGLGLLAYDCYRPQSAVDDFAAWSQDPDDVARKPDFYPGVDKQNLFELGYVARRSGHSRGSTVDVTLVDLASVSALDMGGRWDLFDPVSWPHSEEPHAGARANRALLRQVMTAGGFRPYDQEWWHFTLENEPFPDTYFAFPVAATD